jgi:glycosyltransferase involved in cell wall biosynthesis
MKVCLIGHTSAHFTTIYAHYLRDRGHDVRWISFDPTNRWPGFELYMVGEDPFDPQGNKWIYALGIPKVRRLLRRIRPDVVSAHYMSSNGLVAAACGCRPLAVSVRGSDIHDRCGKPLWRTLFRCAARRVDLFHVVSEPLAQELEAVGVERSRMLILPLGVDPDAFPPRTGPRRPGPSRIICTRQHHPMYDHTTLIRALGRLRNEGIDFECRCVGAGVSFRETQTLIEQLRLEGSVKLLGQVPNEEVASLLADSDIYVSASTEDGTSSSLLEGMACGVFPVVSDLPANRCWVGHENNGLLFEVGNNPQCAAMLKRAMEDAALRDRAAELNPQIVRQRADRKKLLQAYEDYLLELVARGGQRGAH